MVWLVDGWARTTHRNEIESHATQHHTSNIVSLGPQHCQIKPNPSIQHTQPTHPPTCVPLVPVVKTKRHSPPIFSLSSLACRSSSSGPFFPLRLAWVGSGLGRVGWIVGVKREAEEEKESEKTQK